MNKKKYYAITTSMLFEKTVLVPVDSVKDIDEAIDLVDAGVESGSIMLLDEEAECETKQSEYADKNGMYIFSEKEAACYQIVGVEENPWISTNDELPNAYEEVEILMNNGDIHKDILLRGKFGNLEWRDWADNSIKAWRYFK